MLSLRWIIINVSCCHVWPLHTIIALDSIHKSRNRNGLYGAVHTFAQSAQNQQNKQWKNKISFFSSLCLSLYFVPMHISIIMNWSVPEIEISLEWVSWKWVIEKTISFEIILLHGTFWRYQWNMCIFFRHNTWGRQSSWEIMSMLWGQNQQKKNLPDHSTAVKRHNADGFRSQCHCLVLKYPWNAPNHYHVAKRCV